MYRRFVNWLAKSDTPAESRRASRFSEPSVEVFYWDGSAPVGHRLRDISATGAYLYTTEQWYAGTVVRLLLQAKPGSSPGSDGNAPPVSMSIPARVVWQGADGVALEFMFRTPEDRDTLAQLVNDVPKGPPVPLPSSAGRKTT